MLEIEVERRLETVAVIGLNVTDPLVCYVAPAGEAECSTGSRNCRRTAAPSSSRSTWRP